MCFLLEDLDRGPAVVGHIIPEFKDTYSRRNKGVVPDDKLLAVLIYDTLYISMLIMCWAFIHSSPSIMVKSNHACHSYPFHHIPFLLIEIQQPI